MTKKVREPLFHLVKRTDSNPKRAWLIRIAAFVFSVLLCAIVTVGVTGEGFDFFFRLGGIDLLIVIRQCLSEHTDSVGLWLRSTLQRDDEGQGNLPVTDIVHGGFAYFLGVRVVEDVVLYLETQAEESSKLSQGSALSLRTTGRLSPRFHTSLEELSGLLVYYLEILLLSNPHGSARVELQQLAGGEHLSEMCDNGKDSAVVNVSRYADDLSQQVIPHEHRHLVGPKGRHRRSPTAGGRVVHHIIVHERCRVQQL